MSLQLIPPVAPTFFLVARALLGRTIGPAVAWGPPVPVARLATTGPEDTRRGVRYPYYWAHGTAWTTGTGGVGVSASRLGVFSFQSPQQSYQPTSSTRPPQSHEVAF